MEEFDPDVVKKFEKWTESEEDNTNELVELLAPDIPSKRAKKATILFLGGDNYTSDPIHRHWLHLLLIGESVPNKILAFIKNNINNVEDIPTFSSNINAKSVLSQSYKRKSEIISIADLDKYSNSFQSKLYDVMINSTPDDSKTPYQCKVIASAGNSSKIPIRILNEFDLIVQVKSPNKKDQYESSRRMINRFDQPKSNSENIHDRVDFKSELNHYLKWVNNIHPIFQDDECKSNIISINKRLVASNTKDFHQVYKPYLRTAISFAKLNRSSITADHYYRAIAFHNNKSVETVKKIYNHNEDVEFSATRSYVDNSSEIISQLVDLRNKQFEKIVSEIWDHRGWNTSMTPKQDKGIDVVAEKYEPFHQKQLLQVKKYTDRRVSSEEIQQYASLKQQQRDADMVVVVTTSEFSKNAREISEQLNVKLVNGTTLTNIINDINYTDRVL